MAWPKVTLHAGPFLGMRYISRPEDWDHRYVYLATNAFPTADGGYALRVVDNTATLSAAPTQGQHVFRTADGTVRDMVVAAGELWRRAAGVFTKDVSTTNLTSASITLNSSGRVYLTTFNNKLVVSDGTNTPFTWDGTVSAGLTKLTNAPVAFGPPTVYYAKLFFVKNTARDTIVWSEENDATTGYEAGGFNNAWTLSQAGSEPLNRILGRNDALYYWRANSIGTIRGAVASDFTASGVHDDVSREVGTTAAESVLDYRGFMWFVDRQGRPYRFAPGGPIEPIWQNIGALFPEGGVDAVPDGTGARAMALTPTEVTGTLVAPFHFHRAVVFAWTAGAANYTHLWAFDVESGRALCRLLPTESGAVVHVAAGLHSTIDYPCLVTAHTTGANNTVAVWGSPTSPYGALNFGVTTGPMMAPLGQALQASRLRVGVLVGPALTTQFVSVKASVVTLAQLGNAASALPGTILLSAVASAPSERVATWGLNRRGRWQQYQISVEGGGGANAAMVTGIDLEGALVPLSPKVTT